MTESIYTNGEYLRANATWHVEDSAWKADQISYILDKNNIRPKTIAEIGCGAGAILSELSRKPGMSSVVTFKGYDISPQAIGFANASASNRVSFYCEDMFVVAGANASDVLLVIDVFEHVPDYLGFVSQCRGLAPMKIYHIPLDVSVSSVLRDNFDTTRSELGHLHAFTASTALATLRDTGHEIVDVSYTCAALDLFKEHASVKRAIANVPRWLISKLSPAISARLFGGFSLLVLAR